MEPMNHQVMGYDRAITMFSPDGRLLQVEYAKKTVRQGSTALGMVCSDGVILVTDKRIIDPLIVASSVEKIFKVDEHMGATAAGILSDARVLVERAQLLCQQHRVSYDAPVDVLTIVKDVCDLKQICTQSGGLRPFGVSLLLVGVDEAGPRLYKTDPTGIYFEYKACVIGEGETDIEEILNKEYKPSITMEDGFKLAIRALNTAVGGNLTCDRLDCARVTAQSATYEKMDKTAVDKYLKSVKKK